MRVEKLERNQAAELEVLGLVNHAHAPAAYSLEDPIVGDRLT